MRQGQQNKRARSRGRKGANPLTRTYESNGPDVKIRGTASHVADKYLSLSRDAQASGDRVMAENYLQHAEHYLRIIAAANPVREPQEQPRIDDHTMRNGFAQEGIEEAPAAAGGESPSASEQPANGHDAAPHANGSMNGHAVDEASDGSAGDGDEERPRKRRPARPRQRRATVEAADDRPQPGNENAASDDGAEKPVRRRRTPRPPKAAAESAPDGDAPGEAPAEAPTPAAE